MPKCSPLWTSPRAFWTTDNEDSVKLLLAKPHLVRVTMLSKPSCGRPLLGANKPWVTCGWYGEGASGPCSASPIHARLNFDPLRLPVGHVDEQHQ